MSARQNPLPPGWRWVSIKDLGRWRGGGTPSKANLRFWSGNIPWVSPKDMKRERIADSEDHITPEALEASTANLIDAGSVLVVTRSGILEHTLPVAITDKPVAVNQDLKALTPREGISAEYAALALRAFESVILHECSKAGTTVASIEFPRFQAFSIPVAPEPEQRRIVAEIEKQFTRLDAGVEALKRLKGHLRRYSASILNAAFEGQLAPSEAALARTGRRNFETADQLLDRVLAQRPRAWEEWAKGTGKKWIKYSAPVPPPRDLPDLPEGWCWTTWDQIGFSQNGRAFPSNDYAEQGVRLLRPGNLHASGRMVWAEENTRRLPERYAREFLDFLVGPGELVMNLTAQSLKDEFLGRICMTGVEEKERCLLNQRQARLQPILISPRFVFWLFKSPVFRRFVDTLNTGSLIQHMFTSQLAEFAFPLPPLPEQKRIVQEVEARLSVVERVETTLSQSILRASRLRRGILKAAFQGRLVKPNNGEGSINKYPARTMEA